MGKEVKFKCPNCGSNHVGGYWGNDKYVLLCEECNAMAEFPVTSSEDMDHLFDLEYNEWVEHEWPEYTTTCANGCCDINLSDEEEKKCSMGEAEPTKEWYRHRITVLEHEISDQCLIIEALLDKIRDERNH